MIVQTFGDYPRYATPDDEVIARILHLPQEMNILPWKHEASRVKEHIEEYKIDNRSVYDIIRPAKITISIHMSSSTSPRGTAEGHFMPSTTWLDSVKS